MAAKHYFFLSFFLLTALLANSQALTHYTDQDGLAGNTTYYIHQDPQNYLWITTETGVSRFDGYRFVNFYQKNGLSDNENFGITELNDGKLWFHSSNGKPCSLQDGQFVAHEFQTDSNRASGGFIMDYVSYKGAIYAASFGNGLLKVEANGVKQIPLDITPFIPHLEVFDGQLYIFASEEISIWDGESLEKVIEFEESEHILRCARRGNQVLLKGVFSMLLFNLETGKAVSIKSTIPLNQIIHFSVHQGEFWAGTLRGAMKLKIQGDSVIAEKPILPDYSVSSICSDHEGNLWFSTLNNGIYMQPKVSTKYVPNINRDLYSVTANEGFIYAGASSNTIFRIKHSKIDTSFVLNPKGKTYKADKVTQIDFRSDSMWLGMQSTTALLTGSDTTDFRLFARSRLYHGNYVFFATPYSCYRIPVDSLVHGLAVNRERFTQAENLDKYQIYKGSTDLFFQGSDNKVWFSANRKLYTYQNGEVKAEKLLNSPLEHSITDFVKLNNGNYAISTFGGGLFLGVGPIERQITTNHGLSSDFCKFIRLVDENRLLLVTKNGINMIDLKPDTFSIATINHFNGLTSNEINDVLIKDDTIWAATATGLVYFPVAAFYEKTAPAILQLEKIFVQDEVIDTIENLKYHQNELSFQFSAISFRNNDKVRLRYRLFKSEPWTFTQSRVINFKSLEPRKYQLEVNACLPNGNCSATYSLGFEIRPPIWRQSWFLFLLFVVFIITVYLFFRIRILTYNRDVVKEILESISARLKKEKSIVLKDVRDGSNTRVVLNKVLYIESSKNYISIFQQGKQELVVRMTLKEVQQLLENEAPSQFLRAHKSYIINRLQIEAVHGSFLKVDGQKIPIGRKYQQRLQDLLKQFK